MQTTELPFDFVSAGIAVAGAFISWLLADTKSKSRISFIEEKLAGVKSTLEILGSNAEKRIVSIELFQARSEQERKELHSGITRLDNGKASKELVDSLRSDVNTLRVDMDKRFDRLERIIIETVRGESR